MSENFFSILNSARTLMKIPLMTSFCRSVHSCIFAWSIERSIKSLLLQISIFGVCKWSRHQIQSSLFSFYDGNQIQKSPSHESKTTHPWPKVTPTHWNLKVFHLPHTHIGLLCAPSFARNSTSISKYQCRRNWPSAVFLFLCRAITLPWKLSRQSQIDQIFSNLPAFVPFQLRLSWFWNTQFLGADHMNKLTLTWCLGQHEGCFLFEELTLGQVEQFCTFDQSAFTQLLNSIHQMMPLVLRGKTTYIAFGSTSQMAMMYFPVMKYFQHDFQRKQNPQQRQVKHCQAGCNGYLTNWAPLPISLMPLIV